MWVGPVSPTCLPLRAFHFVFGKLYKLSSIKRIMLLSQAVFLLGSLVCATAVSSKMFVLGRALTGLAAASLVAGGPTLLTQIVPLRLRPVYTGVFGAIECVAVVIAPVLGGILAQKLSWHGEDEHPTLLPISASLEADWFSLQVFLDQTSAKCPSSRRHGAVLL